MGEAHLVLGEEVLRVVLPVEVLGVEEDFEARLGEIAAGGQVQVVVVGLEPDLPAGGQQGLVAEQLPGVGQAALVVAGRGPGVAEVDVDALHLLAGGEQLGQALDVVGAQGHVVRLLLAVGLLDVPPGHAQNVQADIDADEIHVPVGVGRLGQEHALAAAQVQVDGPGAAEHLLPAALLRLRLGDIVRAGGQLRPGPGLSTYAHGTSPCCDFAGTIIPGGGQEIKRGR